MLDPRLVVNGLYDLKLIAWDAAGNGMSTWVTVEIGGGVKLGAVRLSFADLRISTGVDQLTLRRVYDGLDLSKGPLGYGWRWEWDGAHGEQPEEMSEGWSVTYISFPPSFELSADYAHPVRLLLQDGRVFSFVVEAETEHSLASVPRRQAGHHRALGHRLHPAHPRPQLPSLLDEHLRPLHHEQRRHDVRGPGLHSVGAGPTTRSPPTGTRCSPSPPRMARWSRLRDEEGVEIDLRSATVTLDGEDLVRFTRTGGFVTAAENVLTGDRVTYTQDADGNLTDVGGVDGSTSSFTYDRSHRLASYVTDGLDPETWTYDAAGRLIAHTQSSGATTSWDYDDDADAITVTDALGASVTSTYNDAGKVVEIVDARGGVSTFDYDADGNEISQTDPLGNTTESTYDDRGRRTMIRDATGAEVRLAYGEGDRVTSATDGEGREFREELNSSGAPTAWVLPDGTAAMRFAYSDRTVTQTDAMGHTWTKTYDDRGRVTQRVDEEGRTSTAVYDDAAHTVEITTAEGEVHTAGARQAGPLHHARPRRWPGLRLRLGRRWPRGLHPPRWGHPGARARRGGPPGRGARRRRSGAGVRLRRGRSGGLRAHPPGLYAAALRPQRRRGGAHHRCRDHGLHPRSGRSHHQDRDRRRRGRRDQLRRRRVARSPSPRGTGARFDFTWDKSERLTEVIDPDGNAFDLGYDVNGRLSSIVYPNGATQSFSWKPSAAKGEQAPLDRVVGIDGVGFTYDWTASGAVDEVEDDDGNVTSYRYDSQERLTGITAADGGVTTFTYGTSGLEEVTLPSGASKSWTFTDGVATSETRADGSTVYFEHPDATTLETTLPGGDVLTVAVDPDDGGRAALGGSGGDVYTWSRPEGQVEHVETDDGASVAVTWTAAGSPEVVLTTLPDGTEYETRYAYDAVGNLVELIDPDGEVTVYAYDDLGRLTDIDRPNGTSTAYDYSVLHRPDRITHFVGTTVEAEYAFTYDDHARVSSSSGPDGDRSYTYDGLGRVSAITTDGDTRSFTWDAVGNLVSQTDPSGTTTYTYDADHRLLSATGPAGTTTYGWSDRGALEEIDGPGGVTTYTYDDLDRLTEVLLPDGDVVSYGYDALGRLIERSDADGSRRCLPLPATLRGQWDCAVTYGPRSADPEVLVHGPRGVAAVLGADTLYPWTGLQESVVGVTDSTGAIVAERDWDAWGVGEAAAGAGFSHGWLGERHDEATGLVYLRARWYHPETGRFLTPDRFGAASEDPRSLHRYLYSFGDPVNRFDRTGEYTIGNVMSSISIQGILAGLRQVTHHLHPRRGEAAHLRRRRELDRQHGQGSSGRSAPGGLRRRARHGDRHGRTETRLRAKQREVSSGTGRRGRRERPSPGSVYRPTGRQAAPRGTPSEPWTSAFRPAPWPLAM